ncbi:peptidylprolyl isomerase [uncultured Paludibaculum sp.]|uniref:peptidylprolyl isomerase n=1 Tax=uncultured Paludibaculum sp. TaxID=1765020 RepID=UPI002AAC1E2D|nr:peptidylprolyl isomerase [uncultured Paludibaculum sp.]
MRYLPCLAACLLLVSCGDKPAPPSKKVTSSVPLKDQPMPDVYKVLFDTSKGSFVVEVHKDWAPIGAARFWMLVNTGFFNDTRFFRVRPGFIAQFGLSGDPQTNSMLSATPVDDDPVKQKNMKGTISFAQGGKRSRRTQMFVNLKDNSDLDKDGFAPFGKVTLGLDVFEKLYSGYGEWEPPGRGPNATRILTEGNNYLDARFPRLDKILRAKVVR